MRWALGRRRCTVGDVTFAPILGFLEGPELIIVLVVILVLFGGAKLPQLARSLGSAQREFKKGLSGDEDEKSSNASKSVNTASESDSDSGSSDKS